MIRQSKPIHARTGIGAVLEAAKEHRLELPKCNACGFWFPPSQSCPHCLAADFAFKPVSGRGTVFSFVTFHRVHHPAFASEVPYVVALVELEEGPRLVSNIVGIPVDKVKCEMPVKVVFDDVAEACRCRNLPRPEKS